MTVLLSFDDVASEVSDRSTRDGHHDAGLVSHHPA